MRHMIELAFVALISAACGANQSEPQEFPDANDPAYAASFDGERDPRVSTSAGVEGGIVVLWPRIVPGEGAESVSEQAAAVQQRLQDIVRQVFPDREIDVRPEPQRACPRTGCDALSIGAVLAHRGEGCALVAMINRPGESATRLVPWSTGVRLRESVIPFRDPPESQVAVQDYPRCRELMNVLEDGEPAVIEALTLAGGDSSRADE